MGDQATDAAGSNPQQPVAGKARFRPVGLSLRRLACGTGAVLGLTSVFVIAAASGLVIHIQLPPMRRLFARVALGLVNDSIQGRIEVQSVDHLRTNSLEVRGVRILDPTGRVVIDADRLQAYVATGALIGSALRGSGDILVRIPHVRSDRMAVQLEQQPDGNLSLVQAFLPRPKPPRPPGPPSAKPPRHVVVDLPVIEIGGVAAYGNMAATGPIDAEVRSARGAVHVDSERVSVTLEPSSLMARKPLPVPASGMVKLDVRSPGAIWGSFAGQAGDIELSIDAKLDGRKLDATVTVPSVRGETLGALIPSIALKSPAAGRIELHGDVAKLDSLVHLNSGTARIDARGPLITTGKPRAELDVEARGVDLSTILVDAPPSLLGGDAHVEVSLSGTPTVKASGSTMPGAIAGIELPGTDFEASFEGGKLQGKAAVHEPGIPIDATFEVDKGAVSVTASSRIASLDAAPRLQRAARGSATARLSASWREGQLDAVLAGDFSGLSRDPIGVRSGRVNAHAWGAPSSLAVNATVTGAGIDAAGLRWKEGNLVVRGPVRAPLVEVHLRGDALPNVDSSLALSLGKRVAVSDLKIELGRGRESFAFHSEHVELGGGSVDFGGIAIDGLGEPMDGVVRVGTDGFDVRLVSTGVDLGKLADVVGVREPRLSGTAAIDIDVRSAGKLSNGCVKIDVSKGLVDPLPLEIGGAIRARLGGSHVEFDAALAAGSKPAVARETGDACMADLSIPEGAVVALRADGDLALAGTPMKASSWRDATGTARLTELGIDLEQVKKAFGMIAMLTKVELPGLGGRIKAAAEITRADGKAPPAVSANVRTEQFNLTTGSGTSGLNLTGHDLGIDLKLDSSGLLNTQASVSATGKPPLARLDSNTRLNWGPLLDDPKSWRRVLNEAQTHARINVPQQPLSSALAPWMGEGANQLPLQSANVSLGAEIKGTILAPQMGLRAYVDRPSYSGETLPALVCIEGSYDGTDGMLRTVLRRGGVDLSRPGVCSPNPALTTPTERVQDVGMVLATFQVPWNQLTKARSLEQVPLRADAQFKIDGLPLAEMVDGAAQGLLNGSGGVRGLGRDANPELEVNLQVQGLRVGSAFAYDSGSLSLRADGGGIRGGLDLVDAARGADKGAAGRLEADLSSPQALTWVGGWMPQPSKGQDLHLRVKPSRFRASSLSPFVTPVLSYVEGDITGYVDATIATGGRPSRIDEAFLSLSGGAFQIPTVGQEFIDVSAIVRTTAPDQLLVDGFRAKAVSGQVAATAAITMQDLQLKRATAGLSTNEANKIRLTLEGVPMGDVWGTVSMSLDARPDRNDVKVDLRGANVELSESEERTVQDLAPNSEVVVVPSVGAVRTTQWGWVTSAEPQQQPARPWYITVGFANPVNIIRQGMRFSVTSLQDGSEPLVAMYPDPQTGGLRLTGKVRVADGRVDIVGKHFNIESYRAQVAFEGAASNPELNVTARWDAPDGTRVYADVTGKLQTMNVQLRSDPPRPPGEILALILVGESSTDASSSALTSAEASRAGAGVGTGVAAAGFNQLLAEVAPVGISTRVDTSQRNNVRPTVIVDIARNISAEATVNTGAVPLGQNPDRYLLTLDWRFLQAWSLRTTVGDAGSSILDVLWTHRY